MRKALFPLLLATFTLFASNEENLSELQGPTFDANYKAAMWKTSLILFGIIVAAFIIMWIYRKYGQNRLRLSNQSQSIKILERRPLSPKTMLYIVEVEGKQVLIAESQVQVARMRELDWNRAEVAKL